MSLTTSASAETHLGQTIEELLKTIPGFAGAATGVARGIHEAVVSGGPQARAFADLLHGTWLGHPLHAVLVEIPIGAWSLAALFDMIALAARSREAAWSADALITAGVATAVPAAMAGAMDYSAAKQEATSSIALHAIMNSAALTLFVGSLAARRSGRRGLGIGLSLAALGIATGSAWVGGDLVYRHAVGVNHSPTPSNAMGWTAILKDNELAHGHSRRVMIGADPVLIHRADEGLYALGAVCSHAGGPLAEGSVRDGCVECPWHQSVFDLRDGHVVHGPATIPQPAYETRVTGGRIEVRLRGAAQGSHEAPAPEQGAQADDDLEQEVGGLGI